MQVKLDLIKPSPNPVRTSWDEDAMNELAESIREQGVIVPIKVRPNDDLEECVFHGLKTLDEDWSPWAEDDSRFPDGCSACYEIEAYVYGDEWGEIDGDETVHNAPFEIVYGHRRVEASRRAGLDAIPAIVEGVDDTDALVQALIENVQREDMEPMDLARALKDLQDETGLNKLQLGKRFGKSHSWVNNHFLLLEEDAQVQELLSRAKPGPSVEDDLQLGVRHVYEVRSAGLTDREDRTKILLKAAEEQLTRHEVRTVAETYRAARTPEEREAVLKVPGKIPAYDRAVKVQAGIDRSERIKERAKTKRLQEDDRAVAEFLDMMKTFKGMVRSTFDAIDYGKFSPEGKRFAVRRIDDLINELQQLKEQLSNE